jgi:cation diffusion facilitator family transporter
MERHGLVDNAGEVRRSLLYTLLANEAVAAAKLFWGVSSGSVGMVSDGFHSLFDGITNVLGLIGIWIASHPPDSEHPYGHRKFETLFTVVVSGLIFFTCYEILLRAYRSLRGVREVEVSVESFVVMAATIAVNLVVMAYEKRRGVELKSEFLLADARHTKSNVLSSLGVVAGLVFTGLGYPMADALAGVVAAAFIAKIGYDILKSATDVLVDTVRMDAGAVCDVVMAVEGVRDCHNIRTRGSEHHVSLDLHIQLDPEITLSKAHGITHMVQDRLREEFPEVKDIVVHTEPRRLG